MVYVGGFWFSNEAKIRIFYNSEDQNFLLIVVDDDNNKVYSYEGTVVEEGE